MMRRIIWCAGFGILLFSITGRASTGMENTEYCTKVRIRNHIEVSLYTPTMFRIRISQLPGEPFPPQYEIPYVIGHISSWPKVDFIQEEVNGYIEIRTERLVISIDPDREIWSVFDSTGENQIYPSDGPIYGMFRDGYTVFDNASAFGEKNNNSRFSHWFYDPDTGRYVDTVLLEDLIADTYFIYGPDYESLFKQMNTLIGPEPLLPKKAYGFFQTQHLGCTGTQKELLRVASEFRARDIPCDNLIIDFEWGDGCDGVKEVKWGSRMDWSPGYRAPLSPRAFIDSLHAMHYSVMLIHHNAPDFVNRRDQGWTESVFDEEEWWSNMHRLHSFGVDGTWQDTRKNDITDSVIWDGFQDMIGRDNRVLFMGCRKMQTLNPWDTDYFALPLNQLMGSRRYPFHWTGDCSYSWNELAWQIKAITNTHGSMKGVTYLSSDAVGADWRIQARWNQFADFSTISRSHHPKPWSGSVDVNEFAATIQIGGRKDQDDHPYGLPGGDTDSTAEKSIRKHRQLRYRLLPYIYSHAHINFFAGMPVCRPMLMAFPEDHRCNADQWPYQYMFGESILVAPVYGDFQTMEIYLPEGTVWTDFWKGTEYAEGGLLRYDVRDTETLPLFIRGGAILVMREKGNWIDPTIPDDPLYLEVYPHGHSVFTMYEDDGTSMDYQDGQVATIRLSCEEEDETIIFRVGETKGRYAGMPLKRRLLISFNGIDRPPGHVSIEGKSVREERERKSSHPLKNAWFFDAEQNRLTIEYTQDMSQETVTEISF